MLNNHHPSLLFDVTTLHKVATCTPRNNMQQKKQKRGAWDVRSPAAVSHIGERLSSIGNSRSHDTRSKLHSSRDSEVRELKKRAKLNTFSSIGGLGIEQQIKKEVAQAGEVLRECEKRLADRVKQQSQKEELVALEHLIRQKDVDIKDLALQIDQLKKSDKHIPEEDSQNSTHRQTDTSEKERMFKLAQEMRNQRQELSRSLKDHADKLTNYLKLRKLTNEIEQKYLQGEGKEGRGLLSYEEFKQRQRSKKEEPKVKKIDFYHHLSPQKQANPSKNMKDLITRKNITLAALKNTRKKHAVEMNQLLAKIEFLRDQDSLLKHKIKEKELELESMEKKFNERKGNSKGNHHFRS